MPSAYWLATPGARCHGGAGNSTEGPPVEPCESSGSVQAVSPRYWPAGVSASVVPPTLVTAGRSPGNEIPRAGIRASCWCTPRHSSPPSSPLAAKAVVPARSAAATALSAAARSVGEKMSSHWPRLMLQMAPG